MLSLTDIEQAADRLRAHLLDTPCVESRKACCAWCRYRDARLQPISRAGVRRAFALFPSRPHHLQFLADHLRIRQWTTEHGAGLR